MITLLIILNILQASYILYKRYKGKVKKLPTGKIGLLSVKYDIDISGNIIVRCGSPWGSVNVQYEIEELSSTQTLSKVKVLSVSVLSTKEKHQSIENKTRLKKMIDESWIDSSTIHWITTVEQIRDSKINQILKN